MAHIVNVQNADGGVHARAGGIARLLGVDQGDEAVEVQLVDKIGLTAVQVDGTVVDLLHRTA